jgi:hypothetical protein
MQDSRQGLNMDPHSDLHVDDSSFVRPYMITGGRTVGEAGEIPLETLVVAKRSTEGLGPDHAAVVRVCGSGEPLSIVEIAVHIAQPIGVARVLVADLTATQHVEQYDTAASENAALVRRLLDGIRSL